jgi:hypothetical protein
MASIKVIAAGYEAELDIPDDDQVANSDRYELMLRTGRRAFQAIAIDASIGEGTRTNQLAAVSALLLAIIAARDAALPELTLNPE